MNAEQSDLLGDVPAAQQKPPKMYAIPAGTPAVACRSCRKTVYWIVSEKNTRLILSVDHPDALAPSRPSGDEVATHSDGLGFLHFVDCPDRDKWRKR